jgi:glutamate synthase (NADPH/NADH) large chain
MINPETVVTCGVGVSHWEQQLVELIQQHVKETSSVQAQRILDSWDTERGNFVQVCPKEMLVHLTHPLTSEASAIPAQ